MQGGGHAFLAAKEALGRGAGGAGVAGRRPGAGAGFSQPRHPHGGCLPGRRTDRFRRAAHRRQTQGCARPERHHREQAGSERRHRRRLCRQRRARWASRVSHHGRRGRHHAASGQAELRYAARFRPGHAGGAQYHDPRGQTRHAGQLGQGASRAGQGQARRDSLRLDRLGQHAASRARALSVRRGREVPACTLPRRGTGPDRSSRRPGAGAVCRYPGAAAAYSRRQAQADRCGIRQSQPAAAGRGHARRAGFRGHHGRQLVRPAGAGPHAASGSGEIARRRCRRAGHARRARQARAVRRHSRADDERGIRRALARRAGALGSRGAGEEYQGGLKAWLAGAPRIPPARRWENAMKRIIALLLGLTTAAVAQVAAAETLKVAVAQRGFWNSTFIDVGLKQGYFKEVGLDIDILYTEGGASTLTPVIAVSIDSAMTNRVLGVVAAYATTMPVKIISAEATGAAESFWYARPSSGIKRLAYTTANAGAFAWPGSPATP